MSLISDSDSPCELCCDLCSHRKFSSKYEYELHYLAHKSEPTLSLVKLSEYSLEKLKRHSYRINRGVAKRTKSHVSPLKISLKKQEGTTTFQVIRKESKADTESWQIENQSLEGGGKADDEIVIPENESSGNVDLNREIWEFEGISLSQQQFEESLSTSRRSDVFSFSHRKTRAETNTADNFNGKLEAFGELSGEELLDRLANEDLTVDEENCKRSVSNSSCDGLGLPLIVSVFSATAEEEVVNRAEDNRSDHNAEGGNQETSKTVTEKKQCGVTAFSVPVAVGREDVDGRTAGDESVEKENRFQNHAVKDPDFELFFQYGNNVENVNTTEKCKMSKGESLASKEFSASNKLPQEKLQIRKAFTNSTVNGIESGINFKNSGMQYPKEHMVVKTSKSSKKHVHTDVEKGSSKEAEKGDNVTGCSSTQKSLKILRKVSQKLGSDKLLQENRTPESKGKEKSTKMGANSSPTKEFQSEFVAPHTDFVSPVVTHSESEFSVREEQNKCLREGNDCGVLLNPVTDGQNDESSTFNAVNNGFRSEPYLEGNNGIEEPAEVVSVSFSSMADEDPSLNQPQQDPLITNEATPTAGESLNQNFLHSFLNDAQPAQTNIQSESPEYMALERLGQVPGLDGQHGQSNFDLNGSDSSTPMEQLSQQVQRLSNPPQINVISPHHMQAPQPPQLHTGLPSLSPQQSNSFDGLGHIQPPMPPPLYQGFNMYNQSFSSQGSQQLPPRPPMLQQRPQIQTRSFQGIGAPRPRSRSYPSKRNAMRIAAPQDLPQKQRRVDQSASGRTQVTNLSTGAKIPSGITVTPSKKNLEASKVANVLASRGITVTPSPGASRQSTPSNRSQQRSNPVLNIGPGVSITTNNNNRGSGGGFAHPAPRRNSPIVNSDVERPERCATVDLTQDDDSPPLSHSRPSAVRFSCNQCTKVFSTSNALENHKSTHRTAGILPYKCDKCTAQYPNASGLQQHKAVFHKGKQPAPDLAIPIVDLNHPGARDQLAKCGVHCFLPLSQLQSNSLGFFGVPLVQLDSAKEKTVTNLNSLGASNILVLGKMKTLAQSQTR